MSDDIVTYSLYNGDTLVWTFTKESYAYDVLHLLAWDAVKPGSLRVVENRIHQMDRVPE